MRDSWFTRRTRWSSYHTRMIHHESWGSHTPTVLQNLHKRGTHNQLKHRLSRTNKPKSHHKTNTFCPITRALATHGKENKNRRSRRICGFIVREGGVEPPLHHWNTDLNRARLPIPPLARTQKE